MGSNPSRRAPESFSGGLKTTNFGTQPIARFSVTKRGVVCSIVLYEVSRGEVPVKLELIVPATQENMRKRKKLLCPPLGLAMVAAVTPPEVEVSLTDENVTVVDFQKETDLVGITALTITAQRAYEIADSFRARGVKVILGGTHPSTLP